MVSFGIKFFGFSSRFSSMQEHKNKRDKQDILRTFRFWESLTNLFFLLSRHKFSSIAIATVVNFNVEKSEKKKLKIRKTKCFEYVKIFIIMG